MAPLSGVSYEHVDAVDPPSVGVDVADVERTADTNVVVNMLETRLSNGEDVILVGNSYGAIVIMEAVKLSGYIPTIAEVNHNPPRPDIRCIGAPFFKYHLAANGTPTTVTWNLDLVNYPPQLTFYNLLDASAADYWTSHLLPSSFKALNATGTYIPYDGSFRTLCIIGEHDNSVSPVSVQSYYLDQEGAKFEVETTAVDHVPMLSMPEVVVDLISRFAGEKLWIRREAESRGS
ncbi:hypothetical protein SLS61_006101 [Didymella pomorum]